MKPLAVLVLALCLPTLAVAFPTENHWNDSLTPEAAAAFDDATARIEAEDFEGALALLKKLAKKAPANPDVFSLLGFAYRKTGDLRQSSQAYIRALYLKPDHLGALEYQGELFLMQNDPAAAEANLSRLEALCPDGCEEREELAEAIAGWRAARE